MNSIFESDSFKALAPEAQAWYKEEVIRILAQNESVTADVYSQLEKLSEKCPVKRTKTKWGKAISGVKPSSKTSSRSDKKAKNSTVKEKEGSGSLFRMCCGESETGDISLHLDLNELV